jgi:hypothetical protein
VPRPKPVPTDAEGHAVEQGDPNARIVEIVSYDADGNEIQRTYGTVNSDRE